MKLRTISALIALPLLFFILFKGGALLFFAAFLLSIIGQYEFYKAFSSKYHVLKWAGYITSTAWYVGLFYDMPQDYYTFLIAVFLFLLLTLTMLHKKNIIMGSMVTFVGFFYVAFSLSHIIMIWKLDSNFFIWYPFIIAFVTDTFAYFTGKVIGSTPLIPTVSPNKTVEGSLGGVIACLVFSYAYARVFNPDFQLYAVFLGLVGSILSQIGDLIASKIKRLFDIKDFGKIMPGHGGVLDRFDSIIITMPLVYYFIVIFNYLI